MSDFLKQFDTEALSEEGAFLHLKTPGTDELCYIGEGKNKKPVGIKLKGPDSDVWVKFVRKASKNPEKKDESYEEVARKDSELFAKMTIELVNIPGEDGKPLETTHENCVKLYRNYKDIRMQALEFVMGRENFTRKPLEG